MTSSGQSDRRPVDWGKPHDWEPRDAPRGSKGQYAAIWLIFFVSSWTLFLSGVFVGGLVAGLVARPLGICP